MSAESGRDGTSRFRPTSLGGLVIVLASTLVSLASYRVLGDRVRIRWTVGVHYGPEYAPTTVVVAVVPVVVGVLYVGFRWLGQCIDRTDGFDGSRDYYELAVLVVLGALVVAQVTLTVVNLVP